jgi:hypothetical protein
MSHSRRQEEYARFKMELLRELKPRWAEAQVAAVVGGRPYDVVLVRTLAHRALAILRSEFYGPSKVVPEWIAEELNPRMLAIWFMDDGHTRIRPGRQPISEIATVGFSEADLQVLVRGLFRLGLPATVSHGRLHFDTWVTERLSQLIAPFVPPTMRYKLHPKVEARVSFDPARLAPGDPEVMFDTVEVEDVTDRPRNDTTFFCIDVEDTHNFVTSGGVVHNCRPPGNRDPHPAEIENCQEWLFAQLELIRPRVVCTLGNFATKLLRGDPTGITRLHGREEVRVIGPRAVRLYPLFHPAAALYTPANVEVLRADFARIPELLALPEPPQPEVEEPIVEHVPEPAPEPEPVAAAAVEPGGDADPAAAGETSISPDQLGLF